MTFSSFGSSLFARLLFLCGAMLRRSGVGGVRRLAAVLGFLLWTCLPGRRRLATQAVRERLGVSGAEAKRIARQSFTENARSFLETALIPCFGFDDPRVRVTRPDLLRRMNAGERPVVAATAHFGAWELLAGLFGDFPAEYPHVVVVRRSKNAALNDFTSRMRGSRGAVILGHRDAAFSILRALKRNGVTAFLVDHNTNRNEAVFLPFLGRAAAVNKGPALLAVRAEALVFAVFLRREGEDYVFHIEELADTATLDGGHEANMLTVARAYTEAVERMVRLAPEQWFWMHNRWKTRPCPAPDADSDPNADSAAGSGDPHAPRQAAGAEDRAAARK